MWNWLAEKVQMPRFVWMGVLLILVAIAYQIFRAQSLLINLNDRVLQVARAEKEVADSKQKVIEVTDSAIDELERLKRTTPEAREKFSAAQMVLRDDVKKPLIDRRAVAAKE